MTSRKIKIWSEPVAHAQTIQVELPAHWIEENFFDDGVKHKIFCCLSENGVKTRVVRSTGGGASAVWSIETTFSSSWKDPLSVMPRGFVRDPRFVREVLTAEEFRTVRDKVLAMVEDGGGDFRHADASGGPPSPDAVR